MKLLIEEYKIAKENKNRLNMNLYKDRIRKRIIQKGLKKTDISCDILKQIEELNLCEEKVFKVC